MKRILLTILFLILHASQSLSCELTMGYRMTGRLPNINEYPDNRGLYFDLYSKASEMIGCQLKIERLPKKRVLRYINEGIIDFYPGLTFTAERSETIYFFENGLPSFDVGISRQELPEIYTYHDLRGKSILIPMGAPKNPGKIFPPELIDSDDFAELGISVRSPSSLSFDRAIEVLLDGYADFYIDEIGTLSFYLKQHPRRNELKYHFNCCGSITDLTLGFSRASKHYSEEKNRDFDASSELSYNNFPYKLKLGSKADELSNALKQLKQEGFTDRLFAKYYGIDFSTLLDN